MTSRERVRAVLEHKEPDRFPVSFELCSAVKTRLLKEYNLDSTDRLIEKFDVDIVYVAPKYIGPKLKDYINDDGKRVTSSYWGYEETYVQTAIDSYPATSYYPLAGVTTLEQLAEYTFPSADWFDYSQIEASCDKYKDKAIIIGHEGPFHMATYLMSMEEFLVLMVEEPEVALKILEGMNTFEMEYYRRTLEAANGKVDILRTHDDYGTQISLLFSTEMFRNFITENTKKLVDLAHSYNAFFMQHSCGAVEPLIEEFINCGVDCLDPIQKVAGMEIENLQAKYGGRIVFHGGIDTQELLPNGTASDVRQEVERFFRVLGKQNGYILMASQSYQSDVPTENIEAIYNTPREVNLYR